MAVEPQIRELTDNVRAVLVREGTLASLKAQLRAAVAGVLESQKEKSARRWTEAGATITYLQLTYF